MSCPENTTNCGCTNSPCGCKISSDDVAYQGPDLSCTGINNCDTLTTVIQKIDDFICGPDMVQTIIYNIENNTSLFNQFVTIVNRSVDCDTIFNCLETTTTTTTEAPTPTYCYTLTAIDGRVTFYWTDADGNPQSQDVTDGTIYACAQLDSVATSGPGLPEIDGGSTICTNESQCVSTTTTTTTAALLCTCIEIVIDQNDLDRATGNTDGELDNVVFLSSPASGVILCDGGTITNAFNIEEAYKFCITASAFPLLQLYYYRDNFIVSEPDLESFLVNMSEDCSVNGDCVEPTTTTTTTVAPTTTTTTTLI